MSTSLTKHQPRDLTPFLARIRQWCSTCEQSHRITHPEMVSVLTCAVAQRIAAVPHRADRDQLIAEVTEAIPDLVAKVLADRQ